MTARLLWLRPAALVWAGLAALLLAIGAPAIVALRFPDPDDVLRLVQVRDLLAGQGWFDLTQHRLDAPGGGVAMHWSRLVDLPLAAAIVILRPLLGPDLAETVAAVAVPLATLALALLLVARLAHGLLGRACVVPACLALAVCTPVLAHLMPLRIDHHGWQIVLALAAVSACFARDARRGGLVVGAALATWLSISLEGLPLAAAILGALALRWVRDGAREWFAAAMMALAGASAALFLATRGTGDLALHCDAVAPVHLAVFGWGALGAVSLAKWNPPGKTMLLAGLGAIAAGGAAIMLALAPQCAGGGFAGMDPLVESFWYRGIAEGQPVWTQAPGVAMQALALPLFGFVGATLLWREAEPGAGRSGWFDYTLVLGAALVVTLLVTRAGAVAGALAAVPAGWLALHALAMVRAARPASQAGIALAVLALALFAAVSPARFAPHSEAKASAPVTARANACAIAEAAPLLVRLPRGEILAPMDIGPRLLLDSRHNVIASAHHRGERGMRFAIETFLGSPEAAREALAARGTHYVALCPDSNEVARFRSASPEGLLARLADGERFDWLEAVPAAPGSNLRVWKVIR